MREGSHIDGLWQYLLCSDLLKVLCIYQKNIQWPFGHLSNIGVGSQRMAADKILKVIHQGIKSPKPLAFFLSFLHRHMRMEMSHIFVESSKAVSPLLSWPEALQFQEPPLQK